MARIYISSTYGDLVDARQAVYHALRQMGHDVIAMEDYCPTGQRPVDKCLADVEDCEIFVGILAWHYGCIPPNHDRSITELEFRKAQESKKTCLLFLLHEEAPWPRKHVDIDSDAKRVLALRAEMCRDYLVRFFHTPDELAAAVSVAIGNLEKSAPAKGDDRQSAEKRASAAVLVAKLKIQLASSFSLYKKYLKRYRTDDGLRYRGVLSPLIDELGRQGMSGSVTDEEFRGKTMEALLYQLATNSQSIEQSQSLKENWEKLVDLDDREADRDIGLRADFIAKAQSTIDTVEHLIVVIY